MSRTAERHGIDDLPRWKKALFSILPLLMLGVIGEVALRLNHGSLASLESRRAWRLSLLRSSYPTVYDPHLGHVPRPGFSGRENAWGTLVTIDDRGLRRNGRPEPDGADETLAVGDSFTFGDEVDDDETWPAHLEAMTGTRVRNAGVFGYGLDQIVLRLEALLPALRPDRVIVAIVPDDVYRCELASRYAWKPYFEIRAGALALRNVPVPTDYRDPILKEALGYSHLVDFVLARAAPSWWLSSAETLRAHRNGPEVAQLLVERLHRSKEEYGYELLLVILDEGQQEPLSDAVRPMLERASALGIDVLDLMARLRALEADPAVEARWRTPNRHLTSEGNRWVAAQIAEHLDRKPTPSPAPAE